MFKITIKDLLCIHFCMAIFVSIRWANKSLRETEDHNDRFSIQEKIILHIICFLVCSFGWPVMIYCIDEE